MDGSNLVGSGCDGSRIEALAAFCSRRDARRSAGLVPRRECSELLDASP